MVLTMTQTPPAEPDTDTQPDTAQPRTRARTFDPSRWKRFSARFLAPEMEALEAYATEHNAPINDVVREAVAAYVKTSTP